MTAEKIIKCSTYSDGDNNRVELIEYGFIGRLNILLFINCLP